MTMNVFLDRKLGLNTLNVTRFIFHSMFYLIQCHIVWDYFCTRRYLGYSLRSARLVRAGFGTRRLHYRRRCQLPYLICRTKGFARSCVQPPSQCWDPQIQVQWKLFDITFLNLWTFQKLEQLGTLLDLLILLPDQLCKKSNFGINSPTILDI